MWIFKRAMANNLWYITNWKIKKRTSYDEPNLNGTAKLYCKILGLLLYKNILNCLFKSLDFFWRLKQLYLNI